MARIVLVGEESGEDLHEREQIFLPNFSIPSGVSPLCCLMGIIPSYFGSNYK
jgi:hypothetical protein